jgi:hypothetical protein
MTVRMIKNSGNLPVRTTVRKTKPHYKHLNLKGVECNILADHPIPSYKDKYDMTPHFVHDNADEFICAATFNDAAMEMYLKGNVDSENFKNGKLRRIDQNMNPYFFVYESDTLTLEEQLKLADSILSGPAAPTITSVTFSGSKSIHILVKIPEKYREDIKKDFKYYWDAVAQYIFQDNKDKLDKACASVSRLTRKPNGIRDNGQKQVCYYYNKDACLFESQFEWSVPIHNEELRKMEIEAAEKERKRLLRADALKETDEFKKLENMHKKVMNGPFDVAYNAIHGDCPAGENYVAALKSLKARGFSKEIQKLMLDNVSAAHPSNISKTRAKYLLEH